MKNKKLWVVALFLLARTVAATNVEVVVETKNLHVPKGFDSNDNVEIVATGTLPNTCYRRPFGEAKIVDNQISINIKATKVSEKNTACIMALVPYMVSVPLGQLSEGNYEIVANPGGINEKTNAIDIEKPHSASIDNFTYANVTQVKNIDGSGYLAIEGTHPSSCMEIDRIELIANKNNDTYAVLPIIKQIEPICDTTMKPFVYNVRLPEPPKSDVLMHVRKLDGNALNYLVKTSAIGGAVK